MFEKVSKIFDKYTSDYDMKDDKISLKYHHSYAVSKLMGELATNLGLNKEEIEIAKIIGLLHDIGRFEQWKKFKSFDDRNVDHADESCNYLFKDEHTREFLDNDKYDLVIENAIRYHNKLTIPEMDDYSCMFTKMIRDMDKVDIYKQCAIHYEYTFNKDELSKEVIECFNKEESIPHKFRKSKSDSIIIMLAFIFDINFEESFDILVETDNFDLFLSVVEITPGSEEEWRKIREKCFDKINRGIIKKEG